tara:strand:+ start:188 stop:622 length:435 start_codon:yes stop_codon:yes gene_type:complete
MAYSQEEINVIHQQSLAEPDSFYSRLDGATYVGTEEGRLRLVDNELLEIRDSVQQLENTVTEIVQVVDNIVTEPEPEPITSYFEIDPLFGFLVPVDPIANIIPGNIFNFDTGIAALVPQEYDPSSTDAFWEDEGAGTCIIPKAA